MAEERTVPGAARDNNDRVQERGYESDFARLPEEEVDAIDRPGGGPHGGLDDRGARNLPLIVMAVGALVAFSAFGLDSGVPLAVGLVIVVAGAIWAGVRGQTIASGHGTGTVDSEQSAHD